MEFITGLCVGFVTGVCGLILLAFSFKDKM